MFSRELAKRAPCSSSIVLVRAEVRMGDRVTVYIDGSNFYNGCRDELGRTDVKIGEFAIRLVGDREHVRTYYYNVPLSAEHPDEARRSQQKFYAALARTPYLEVRLGRMVKRSWRCKHCNMTHERWLEKGVDMRLGVDMLSHASRDLFDVAILVSGDGDYEHAVQAVKNLGKHVEVACFLGSRSDALLRASDRMHQLDRAFFDGLFVR